VRCSAPRRRAHDADGDLGIVRRPWNWRGARRTSSTVARPAFVSARARGASAGVVTPFVRKRQRRGSAKVVVGVLSDPAVLVFSLSIGKGLMTISMPDRFRLAAPRGRRRRFGMAMGLLEQSRLASCPRPGRTKSTPLTRRRIAVWRLKWPPWVARARRDGRDGSCANGRPRDVGHRCERWRALERERGAAFCASSSESGPARHQAARAERPGAPAPTRLRTRSFRSSWCRGFAIRVLRRRRGRRRVSACCAVAGATLSRRARRHSC
jgi:hypothetical protein